MRKSESRDLCNLIVEVTSLCENKSLDLALTQGEGLWIPACSRALLDSANHDQDEKGYQLTSSKTEAPVELEQVELGTWHPSFSWGATPWVWWSHPLMDGGKVVGRSRFPSVWSFWGSPGWGKQGDGKILCWEQRKMQVFIFTSSWYLWFLSMAGECSRGKYMGVMVDRQKCPEPTVPGERHPLSHVP